MADTVDRRVVQLDVIINGLEDVKKRLGEVETSTKSLDARFTSLTDTMKRLAQIAGVGALLELGKAAITAEAQLYRLSQSTGASVENLSKFQQVAAMSGTDIGTVALAMEKMERAMFNATQTGGQLVVGAKNVSVAFKTLGVDIKDSSGNFKEPDAMLLEIAQKMETFRDGAGKTALAMQIFGRSGAAMIPMLHDLATAHQLNISVTTEEAKRAEELVKQTNLLIFSKKMLAEAVVGELVPVLTIFMTILTNLSSESGSLTDNIHKLKSEGTLRAVFEEAGMYVAKFIDFLRVTGQTLSTLWSLFELLLQYIKVALVGLADFQVHAENALRAAQEVVTGVALPKIDTSEYDAQLKEALKDKEKILLDASTKLGTLLEMDTKKIQTEYQKQLDAVKLVDKYSGDQYKDARDLKLTEKYNLAPPPDASIQNKAEQELAALKSLDAAASLQLAMGDQLITEAEKKLLEIRMSPEWKKYSDAQRADITAAANAAAAKEKQVTAEQFFLKAKTDADKLLATSTADYMNGTMKLTEAEKKLLEMQQDPHWKTLTQIERDAITVKLQKAASIEREIDLDKQLLDGEQALIKGYEDQKTKINDQINALVLSNKNMEYEIEDMGKSKEVIALLNNERERQVLLLKTSDPAQKTVINNLYDERARMIELKTELEAQQKAWTSLSDGVGNFFSDLIMNGKKAFDNLRQNLKQFIAELVAALAKSYVLNLAANVAGGGGSSGSPAGNMLSNMASSALTSSAGGSLATAGANYLAGGSFTAAGGAGTASLWGTGVLTGGGDFVGTGLAGMAGSAALAAGATDAFAAAVAAAVPVIGWIVAIAAVLYAVFGQKSGGPKGGGSASLTATGPSSLNDITPGGQLPGFDTDNNRFYTPNQADSAITTMLKATNSGFQNTLRSLGGTQNGNVVFGLGFDEDKSGSSPNRVSAGATVGGRSVYSARNVTAGKDDTDLQNEIQLQIERMMVSALQASNLPQDIAGVLNKVDVAGASKDFLDQVMSFISSMSSMTQMLNVDPVKAGVLEANMTMEGSWRIQKIQLQALALTYDGTAQGAANLVQATQQYQQAQIQLIATYEKSKQAVQQSFADTTRNIKYSTLDDQGKYNFLQDESAGDLKQALKSGNIDEINRLAGQVNQDINTAFNMLSPDEQRAHAQEYIDKANAASAAIQQHISELQQKIADEGKDQISQIKTIVTDAANKFVDAADTNVTAANTNLTASNNNLTASQGSTVVVNVYDDRVTSNVVNGGG